MRVLVFMDIASRVSVAINVEHGSLRLVRESGSVKLVTLARLEPCLEISIV